MEKEESVVFSNIEVRVMRAGPSGLGDLVAHIRSGPFESRGGRTCFRRCVIIT